jgi:HPt (histidine-containing phosphotransfer) domain-containing protein
LHVAPNFPGPIPVYDLSTLAELEGVFGHARLMELLGHLKDEIAQRLLAPAVNRTALRNDAHALLSVSGSLGFFELSRRCIEMEQACLLGADLVDPLSDVRAAAKGAIAAIEDLVARVVETSPAVCAA